MSVGVTEHSEVRPARARPQRAAAPGRPSRLPEISVLAVVAIAGYAALGWFLKYRYHFALGDALARTLDARLIIDGRDPHAAAIGVYWMPLPTFVQVPFVHVLDHVNRGDYAGPLSTAFWGGATVWVLGHLARDLGLPRVTGFLLALAYAVNPVSAYYAANGMSEAAEFFWISVLLWGLLRLFTSDEGAGATVAGVGLAGLVVSKYEAIPLVLVVAGLVLLRYLGRLRSQNRRFLVDLTLTIGPALWVLLLWFLYMKLITGSFTAFRDVAAATQGGPAVGPAVATAPGPSTPLEGVAAAQGNLGETVHFVTSWVVAFFPTALLLAPLLLVPPLRKSLTGISVFAVGFASIAATTYLVFVGGTYGNARYFTALVPVGAVAVILAASRVPVRGYRRFVVDPLFIGLLLVAGVSGTLHEIEAPQSVEQENRVFALLDGRYNDVADLTRPTTDFSGKFREVAASLDGRLRPRDRVLMDSRFTGPAALFSTHPQQIIINADRDYEQIVAPTGLDVRIDYAVLPANPNIMGLPAVNDEAYKLIHRTSGWTKVWSNPVAEIWKNTDPGRGSLNRAPAG